MAPPSHLALAGLAFFSSFATAASVSATGTPTATNIVPYHTQAADEDDGQPILPKIYDPKAVNPQTVCPGYKASNVTREAFGLSATLTLTGSACNVYGDDIESLQLNVQYQSADRVHVEIAPTYIGLQNQSWFVHQRLSCMLPLWTRMQRSPFHSMTWNPPGATRHPSG